MGVALALATLRGRGVGGGREGRVAADGPKNEVLTEDQLSDVYGVRVRVSEVDGFYLAYPG